MLKKKEKNEKTGIGVEVHWHTERLVIHWVVHFGGKKNKKKKKEKTLKKLKKIIFLLGDWRLFHFRAMTYFSHVLNREKDSILLFLLN